MNGGDDSFLHGPYLTLIVTPESAAHGDTLTFSTWVGTPGGWVALALVREVALPVPGPPSFLGPFRLGRFDANGAWDVTWTVPPGLAGQEMTFQAYGQVASGRVRSSNRDTVIFR